MTYDFDKVINRKGDSYSLKWDVKEGELPLWVADMDFQTAPEILAALQKRLDHGIFGYSEIPDRWADAYLSWWQKRHHVVYAKEDLIFSTGVISILSSVVRKLTTPAEKVVVLTPVYNTFYNSILNNGRQVSECPMLYREGGYQVDYEDLEKKLADPQASLMILCNPHNPIGKIWSLEELKKIGELCKKHSVVVVSDEIHCDLVDPQKEYVPFVLAGEDCRQNAIVCMAPTKTFNLAGIQTAAAAVPNPTLRHKVWRALNTDEVAEPNSFAITAAIAAFEEGEPWLLALQDYLYANKQLVASYLKENCPDLQLLPSEATYLLWLRVADLPGDKTNLAPFIRKETGLYLTAGYHYRGDGKDFMRMNIACPRSTLTDALSRLKKGVELWKEKQIKG